MYEQKRDWKIRLGEKKAVLVKQLGYFLKLSPNIITKDFSLPTSQIYAVMCL